MDVTLSSYSSAPLAWYLGYGLLCYAIGSIPSGLLLAWAFGQPDPRRSGSGNIGATNMLRAGGRGLGAATLLLDALKGVAAVWLTTQALICCPALPSGPMLAYGAGFCATLGHCFPVWLRFRGGKGVATALGVIAAVHVRFSPESAGWLAVFALSWIGPFALTRKASTGSVVTFAILPAFTWLAYGLWRFPLLLSLLVIIRHRDNIIRLLRGKEHDVHL